MDDRLRLQSLRGAYAGKRCFVLGNGPSLNRTDLSRLVPEFVWGANRCYLLFERISWRPAFYVARDPKAVENSLNEIRAMIRDLTQTRFFFPSWAKGELPLAPKIYWYHEEEPREEADRFSMDPSGKIAAASTVTAVSLQLAAYLGFDPIYLIGCDMSYSRISSGKPGEPAGAERTDPDHFDPGYLRHGNAWNAPDVVGMRQDYRAARKACDALGISIMNATVGGKLEEFRRVSYDALF